MKLKVCLKGLLVLTVFMVSQVHAGANPRIAASFVSMNAKLCGPMADLADTCKIAIENTQKLKDKIVTLTPNTSEHKKWADLLPQLQDNENMICESVKENQKIEMVVAAIKFDSTLSVPVSKLNKGLLGTIEFSPSQVLGDSVQLPASSVKMTVYGTLFCQALMKAGGNTTKALESILTEITGKN